MDQILDKQTNDLAKLTEEIIDSLLGSIFVNQYLTYEWT